ncbi:hypothetical protein IS481_13325 [Caldimonas thermodepolymerans]|uniref:Uncharacterized protein n=1 Tax=Caldimonas thermodepolymerans TaxID=215580 RepID=A0A2S5T9N3_9BURK|nr:hypothetical protein [Caldimonas thermodepolymerans]PPE71701.1 hypothetical protein C1702_01540 [Caldimonas thermodepolymerans]QPC30727.1 hypothetical protein IS481_13325 [Caldimonas thermodepolymerans]RDI02654.1 hypothetical protein DES46_10281 [Caldimonas thermodepolymerans]
MAERASRVQLEFQLDDDDLAPGAAGLAAAAAVAPGFAMPGGDAPHEARTRRPRRQPPVEKIEGCLCAHEVLERFEARRAEWFGEELAPFVEGIAQQLRQEARLSEHLHGLPCTDHRAVWFDEMVSDAAIEEPVARRLRVWQPPVWWIAPIVRRHGRPLRMKLPLAQADELAQELAEQLPPEWRNKRVVVQLEVETRLYWGGCAPRGWTPPPPGEEAARMPWQPCSFRGDGIGFSEDLLYLKKGQPTWLHDANRVQAPEVRRSMRPGVGLLVAVPVFTFELQETTFAWIKRQALRVLRWLGIRKTIADRDPTFVQRLREDEAWWAQVFGEPEPGPDVLRLAQKRGARLAPASRPAVAHRPEQPAGDRHVVLIHGGLSSARSGFGAWLETDAAQVRQAGPWRRMPLLDGCCTWRFEHDTFLRVARNIDQLVDALDRAVIGDRPEGTLVLLAHSRGGNVARFALPRLRQRWPGWRFYALTAGSPHQGTGVFRSIGRRWSGAAVLVGWVRDLASGILDKQHLVQLTILERALAYDIPPGFRDVEPAGVARMARRHPGMPEGMWVWGSEWGPGDSRPIGERVWHRVIEDWAGFEADGDGIVPKQSALAGLAEAMDASPVFHTEYFEHEPTVRQIRARLESLLAP